MTVQAFISTQLTDGYIRTPREDAGKFRIEYFDFIAAVDGDATSTIDLVKLPAGPIRIIPYLSRITCVALSTSRTLSIGTRAYTTKADGTQNAEEATSLLNALDVSGAVNQALSTVLKYDMYSLKGLRLFATIGGGTFVTGKELSGVIAFVMNG